MQVLKDRRGDFTVKEDVKFTHVSDKLDYSFIRMCDYAAVGEDGKIYYQVNANIKLCELKLREGVKEL